MAANPFHLAWFLQGSSIQAWGSNWTGNISEEWMDAGMFLDLARNIERAGFDYLGKAKSTAYIAAGTRSATLFVKIAGNSARKQPVRFTVRIARPSAGVLGDATASVTLAAR